MFLTFLFFCYNKLFKIVCRVAVIKETLTGNLSTVMTRSLFNLFLNISGSRKISIPALKELLVVKGGLKISKLIIKQKYESKPEFHSDKGLKSKSPKQHNPSSQASIIIVDHY